MVETKANDISAYIPTNVISITDGQIFLETDLFNQGVRPAINVGTSVSRVGGNAQVRGMRKVSGRLRLDLAQYRDQLERGARLVELLKQSQYNPYPVVDEIVSIWAGTTGQLDDIPVGDVRRFELELLSHLRHNRKDVLDAIAQNNDLSDDTAEALKEAVTGFKQAFLAGETRPINEPPAKPSDPSAENHEKVTREVRQPTEG